MRRSTVVITIATAGLLAAAISGRCLAVGTAAGSMSQGTARSAGIAVMPVVSSVPTLTVTAVGDMCFASGVKRLVSSHGPRAPFSAMRSLLTPADITVGNLECPLSTRGSAVRGKTYTFEGSPKVASALSWAGFDLVALGNNHARDYGANALVDTTRNLDTAKVSHAGAGKNRAAAWQPAIVERNGAKIAYLSFSQIGPANFAAGSSRPGTAFTMNLAQVKRAIRAADKRADYVLVAFHWGIEYTHSANATQVRFGRAAIDSGADLVLSHHPHVVQGVELYKHKLIAYSLGNFIFSPGKQMGHDSMILNVTLTPGGIVSASARPVFIGAGGRPALAKGANAKRIAGIICKTSRGRKTKTSYSKGVVHFSR